MIRAFIFLAALFAAPTIAFAEEDPLAQYLWEARPVIVFADSKTEAYAAKCMVQDAARNYDNGVRDRGQCAQCKLFASEMVGRVADRAVQIHGGAGYVSEYAVERLYRDVRIFRIYEGTTQIQQTVVAKEMMRNFEG